MEHVEERSAPFILKKPFLEAHSQQLIPGVWIPGVWIPGVHGCHVSNEDYDLEVRSRWGRGVLLYVLKSIWPLRGRSHNEHALSSSLGQTTQHTFSGARPWCGLRYCVPGQHMNLSACSRSVEFSAAQCVCDGSLLDSMLVHQRGWCAGGGVGGTDRLLDLLEAAEEVEQARVRCDALHDEMHVMPPGADDAPEAAGAAHHDSRGRPCLQAGLQRHDPPAHRAAPRQHVHPGT